MKLGLVQYLKVVYFSCEVQERLLLLRVGCDAGDAHNDNPLMPSRHCMYLARNGQNEVARVSTLRRSE